MANKKDLKAGVEIIAHKKATKKAVEETKKVNSDLNKLFEHNGITLQIKIATGGKH